MHPRSRSPTFLTDVERESTKIVHSDPIRLPFETINPGASHNWTQ
jgi:hypothetical protein